MISLWCRAFLVEGVAERGQCFGNVRDERWWCMGSRHVWVCTMAWMWVGLRSVGGGVCLGTLDVSCCGLACS